MYLCALENEKFGQCAVKGVYEKHPFLSFFHLASRHQNSFVKICRIHRGRLCAPGFSFRCHRDNVRLVYDPLPSRARPSDWARLNSRMTSSYVSMVTVAAGTARIMLVPNPA